VKILATVLRKRLGEYEGVELDIRVTVSKALEDSRNDVSCASKIFDYMQIKERRRLVTYPCSPSSWTLSHKFRMSSQFSLVRVSSVAFAARWGQMSGELGEKSMFNINRRTNDVVVRICLCTFEHLAYK